MLVIVMEIGEVLSIINLLTEVEESEISQKKCLNVATPFDFHVVP